jgi:hypothetical protein
LFIFREVAGAKRGKVRYAMDKILLLFLVQEFGFQSDEAAFQRFYTKATSSFDSVSRPSS